MIFFDGLYSTVGLLLTVVTIFINKFINKEDRRYPFGKNTLEPTIVIVKSSVILIMCVIMGISSISSILKGGAIVNYSSALIYSIICTICCGGIFLTLKKHSKKMNSELIITESSQWFADTLISFGTLIGFIIASIFIKFNFLTNMIPFIDPLMVLISSVIFLKMPITILKNAFKELFSMSAKKSVQKTVNNAANQIKKDYDFKEVITRVAKTGKTLRIEIDFIYCNDSKLKELDQMDSIRELFNEKIKSLDYEKWVNIGFTRDKKWVI